MPSQLSWVWCGSHVNKYRSVSVELTRGHIQCLCLGALWAGIAWGRFIACHSASHSTSQGLLCGNPVGNSPERASLCFSASANTLEKKSAKICCGSGMSFSLWEHEGYMPPRISIFWRAFARLFSCERQCTCLQKEQGTRFPDYQRPHTWTQSPGGTRGSRYIGHIGCPFCWCRCEGVRSMGHPHPCKSNAVLAGSHLQSVFSNTFSVSGLASSKNHCFP